MTITSPVVTSKRGPWWHLPAGIALASIGAVLALASVAQLYPHLAANEATPQLLLTALVGLTAATTLAAAIGLISALILAIARAPR